MHVVEDDEVVVEAEDEVGEVAVVGGGVGEFFGFEVADGVIAGVADGAAEEAREAGEMDAADGCEQGFEVAEGVGGVEGAGGGGGGGGVGLFDEDFIGVGFDDLPRGGAEEGVAGDAFAADDGFEEEGVGGAGGEAFVGGDGGEVVGEEGAVDGDGGVGAVLVGEGAEVVEGGDVGGDVGVIGHGVLRVEYAGRGGLYGGAGRGRKRGERGALAWWRVCGACCVDRLRRYGYCRKGVWNAGRDIDAPVVAYEVVPARQASDRENCLIRQAQATLFGEDDAGVAVADEASSTFVNNMSLPVHRWFRYSAGFSAEWVESVLRRVGRGRGAGF